MAVVVAVVICVALGVCFWNRAFLSKRIGRIVKRLSNGILGKPTPRSVNYHFTRKCNYECGFCFHTDNSPTTSEVSLDEAKTGLRLLADAGLSSSSLPSSLSVSLLTARQPERLLFQGWRR